MISANDLIALYMGLELQSLALYVVAAHRPRQCTLLGSRPQIFRPRRAVLGHAALRRLADLRLHRLDRLSGDRRSAHRRRTPASASSSASSSSSPALPSRSRRCRSICGRPMSMRARRRRSPPSSPPRPRSPPWRSSRAPCWRRSRRSCPTGSRSSSSSRSPRWCSAPSPPSARPTSSGCSPIPRSAIWATRWSASPPAASEGVRGVIVYMAIYLIMTLGTFACVLAMRRKHGQVEEIADLAGLARTDKTHGLRPRDAHVLARRHPAARRLLRQVFRLPGGHQGRTWCTLAVIGVVASVVGAYYYLRIVKLMYFDEPVDAFEPTAAEVRAGHVLAGVFVCSSSLIAQPLVSARRRGGRIAVLIGMRHRAAAASRLQASPFARSIRPMPRRIALRQGRARPLVALGRSARRRAAAGWAEWDLRAAAISMRPSSSPLAGRGQPSQPGRASSRRWCRARRRLRPYCRRGRARRDQMAERRAARTVQIRRHPAGDVAQWRGIDRPSRSAAASTSPMRLRDALSGDGARPSWR